MGKSLAQLNAEAQKDPYVLDLGNGTTVMFPMPTFSQAAAAWEDNDSVIGVLKAFAAETDRDALEAALMASAPTVPQAVLDDILGAFGMGNQPASPSS
jgi:hypothetical protein